MMMVMAPMVMMPIVVAMNTMPVPTVMTMPVVVTMAVRNGTYRAPINLGYTIRDLPCSCRSAGIGERRRLCRARRSRHNQQPRNREEAKNLFHEFPLLIGSSP